MRSEASLCSTCRYLWAAVLTADTSSRGESAASSTSVSSACAPVDGSKCWVRVRVRVRARVRVDPSPG